MKTREEERERGEGEMKTRSGRGKERKIYRWRAGKCREKKMQ